MSPWARRVVGRGEAGRRRTHTPRPARPTPPLAPPRPLSIHPSPFFSFFLPFFSPPRFPFTYRYVANGHRSSPTSRPLAWDALPRTCTGTPADAARPTDRFAFEGADTGWVTPGGVGGFQLRVGVPPGGADPLVTMAPPNAGRAVDVSLHEAVPHDPAAPGGKAFARVEDGWAGGGAAPVPPTAATGDSADRKSVV